MICVGNLCFKGENMNDEMAQVLREGLGECEQLGDLDNRAILMVASAQLAAKRGRTEESIAMLQV